MSLEGLKAILEKEEVVVTYQAHDFIERPKQVDEAYQAHLRTYVPMHSGADPDALSVEAFTKRFVQAVKNGKTPRGYLTADFGYGKTSTGLFIWEQAAKERLLSIPPFQLNSLMDFIHATYGWVQYTLGLTKPSLQERATQVYDFYQARSIAAVAVQYGIPENTATRLAHDRPQILELAPGDISRFFREMTDLALDAGFSGLVVIADEVQQYLEPEIKAGKNDPVSPLFNIIQDLGGQSGLCCGLLLIIPAKELGVINDQRGDLIDRMRTMALNLKAIYDDGFPIRLWSHLAKTFDFEDHAGRVLRAETLISLSQIAARDDLANGPRTVVNALRRAIQQYLDSNKSSLQPYSPIDLINDFLSGENVFDGTQRIQEVLSRALEHSFVRANPVRGDAIRLAGAFPAEGATIEIQSAFGLEQAFRELRAGVYGEVVIEVGDHANPGTTLRGLEAQEVSTDWLLFALRDFNRNYHENAALVKTRALNGFKSLLKTQILKNDWKIESELEAGNDSSAVLIVEGAFAGFRREFPARRIQISIVFDEEQTHPTMGEFDVWLEFRLRRYLDLDVTSRLGQVNFPVLDEVNHRAELELNLMRRLPDAMNRAMENLIVKVVASEQLTPLFLLALYGYFDTQNQQGLVPKPEQPLLSMQFMPSILESVTNILLDKSVGTKYDAAGARIIEKIMLAILRSRYGTGYHTFMVINTWRNSLREYVNMICRLPSPLYRQGFIPLEGTKDQIAEQLNLSNTALDNFINTFPDLIELTQEFKKAKVGGVRLRIHPLEVTIQGWITCSYESVLVQGKKAHSLPGEEIIKRSLPMGYRQEEIEQAIQLLIERKWAIRDQNGNLCEIPPIVVKPDEVAGLVRRLVDRVDFTKKAFPEAIDLLQFEEESARLIETLALIMPPAKIADPRYLEVILSRAQKDLNAVEKILQRQKFGLLNQLTTLIEQYSRVILPDIRLLTTPDPVVIYSVDLESLHADLLNKADKLQKRLSDQRNDLDGLRKQISTALDSESALLSAIRKANQIQADLPLITADAQSLEAKIRGHVAWTQITRLQTEVLSQIDQLSNNNISLRSQFDAIEREMSECIDQGWETAVQQGPIFERRLISLAEQIRQVSAQASQQFEIIQRRYREALVKISCPPKHLPESLVYSPLDPEKVYEQFYTNIQKAVIATLDLIEENIQEMSSQIRQKLVVDNTYEVNYEKTRRLQDDLINLSEQIPYFLANKLEVIQDEGRFFGLIKKIYDINLAMQPYVIQMANLEKKVELTKDEAWLIEKLPENASINLADILAQIDQTYSTSAWVALRGLWEKNQIQVILRRLLRKIEE